MRTPLAAVLLLCFLQNAGHSAIADRHYAFELEYGSATTNLPIANERGQTIYGGVVQNNPFTFTAIVAAAEKLNIGLSLSSSSWIKKEYYWFDSDQYKDPNLIFESITPLLDLGPFVSEKSGPAAITDGFFAEVGPCFMRATERYELNGSAHSFETSGVLLEFRLGFRTLNRGPLSFTTRAKAQIPLSNDNRTSATGFTLNGLSIFSISCGFCLTI